MVLSVLRVLGESGLALSSGGELQVFSEREVEEERQGVKLIFGLEGWGKEVVIGRCGGRGRTAR